MHLGSTAGGERLLYTNGITILNLKDLDNALSLKGEKLHWMGFLYKWGMRSFMLLVKVYLETIATFLARKRDRIFL